MREVPGSIPGAALLQWPRNEAMLPSISKQVRIFSSWQNGRKGFHTSNNTRGGTRTHNLLLRREAPYPLGHTSCAGQGGHGAEARLAWQGRFQSVFAFEHCLALCGWTPVRGRESTPLDHSGKVSLRWCLARAFRASAILLSSVVARSSVHADCVAQWSCVLDVDGRGHG